MSESSILLDTCSLIVYLFEDALPKTSNDLVSNTPDVYVSVVSLWEIAIKKSIGKLEVECSIVDIANECEKIGIKLLHLMPEHMDYVIKLPFIHKDPFDRIIMSQAIVERMSLISEDQAILPYQEAVDGLHIIWK